MQKPSPSSRTESAAVDGGRQVLTFSLGQEVYGIDILRVKEIRGWTPVTQIPQAGRAVLGVLNLRGVIVPIVDLRVLFGLRSAEFNATTVTIVLSLPVGAGYQEYGFVVDGVRDVVDLTADSLRPAPDVGSDSAQEFIEAIATHDQQMLILLNAANLATSGPAAHVAADRAA